VLSLCIKSIHIQP